MTLVATSAKASGGGSGAVTLIADSLLLVDTATFDFTAIAATFKHLEIYAQLRMTGAVATGLAQLTVNGDAGANYDYEYVVANDVTVSAARSAGGNFCSIGDAPGSSATAARAAVMEVTIPNYAGTAFDKGISSKCACFKGTVTADNFVEVIASQWRNTAAISRITITPSSGNWLAGSRVSLYGIS